MKHFSATIPGYDCVRFPCGKDNCGKTTGGNHGISPEDWIYAVSDGVVALSLRVMSDIFPPSAPPRPSGLPKLPRGIILHVHASFPTELVAIRVGTKPQECEYMDAGSCFGSEGYGLAADKLFAEVGGPRFDQPESFWLGLERAWHEFAKPAYDERVDDKFERCNHCDGVGTVAKEST